MSLAARRLRRFLLVALLAATPGLAQAAWPTQPVRVVVPVAAGGSLEALARILGNRLSETWGQAIVIENLSGAGGNIAFETVARAKPDGHTLLVGWDSLVINPALFRKVGYDPLTDFAPITQTVQAAQVLTVHPGSPARDLAGFVALGKAKPSLLSIGTPGNGSIGHLTLELFRRQAGIGVVHVPYRGGGPAANDLLAGQLDGLMVSLPAVTQHVRAGTMRALGLSTPARVAAVGDVPTFAESGLAGFAVVSWQGLLAPARTPPEIVGQINRDVVRVLQQPAVRDQLLGQGFEPVGGAPEALAALLREQVPVWAGVIKDAGIQMD